MHLADLLIHIDETLDATERVSLEEALRNIEGVIAPRFNRETPHLLLVAYDPQDLKSHNLLNRVKANGYHAQLVVM